jgi:RimJ/RimL family protein N-acetyltransferase
MWFNSTSGPVSAGRECFPRCGPGGAVGSWNHPFPEVVMLFETERLIVRHLNEDDLDAMHAVYGDADAMRWVDDGLPLAREACRKWIEVTKVNYVKRGYGMSAIELRETGEVIGFCGLVHPGNQTQVEIKYAMLRSHWGKGLASEVVVAMLDYGRRTFSMKRICATAAQDNVASHRVLLKAGMLRLTPGTDDDDMFTERFIWQAAEAAQPG